MTENGAMKISCDAIINGFCSAAPPVRIPADEAPRSLVHSEAPPSLIHSDAPPPSLIHSDAPPPSLIHSDAPPPSLVHSEAPPPSLVHSEAPLPSLVLFCFAAPPAGGLHGDPSPDLAPPSVHDPLPSSAVANDLSETDYSSPALSLTHSQEEIVATYFLDMILEVIAVELDDPEALAILHLMAQIAEAEEAPAEILSLGFSVIPVDRAGIWRLGSRRFLPQPPSDLRFHLIG